MKKSKFATLANVGFWILWISTLPIVYVSILVAIFLKPVNIPLYFALIILFTYIVKRTLRKQDDESGWHSVLKYFLMALAVAVFRYLPETNKKAPQIVFTAMACYYFVWAFFKSVMSVSGKKSIAKSIICYLGFSILSIIGLSIFMQPDFIWLAAFFPIFLVFELFLYVLKKTDIVKVWHSAEALFVTYVAGCSALALTGMSSQWFSAVFTSTIAGWILYVIMINISRKLFSGVQYSLSKIQISVAALCLIAMCFVKLYTAPDSELEKDFIIHSRDEGSYDMVLDPTGRYLYAIFGEDVNSLEKIDTAGIEKPVVKKLPGNSQPQRLIYDEQTDRIIVANWGEYTMLLAFFNADTLEPIKVFDRDGMPGGPVGITLDEKHRIIYLLGEHSSGIARIDADTMEWEAYGEAGGGVAYGICYSPISDTLFTTTWLGPFISEVDPDKLVLIRRWHAPYVTYQLECDPDVARIFVTEPLRRRIMIRDTETGSLKKTGKYRTGLGTRDFHVSWEKRILVAGSYIEGMVHVYDIDSRKLLGKWNTPSYVRGVYYHEESGRIFIACKYGILELKTKFKR